MNKRTKKQKVCECCQNFVVPGYDLCSACQQSLEHDDIVEMFGDDADYLEHAGLADKIGNK